MNQLVAASEADPDLGFMARMMALCSLPRTNPGDRKEYKRVNGPYTLYMIAGRIAFFMISSGYQPPPAKVATHPPKEPHLGIVQRSAYACNKRRCSNACMSRRPSAITST